MTISTSHAVNFKTLCRASAENSLALMECTDVATGKPIITICAVGRDNGEYVFTPLAKMFDGNPYEELAPPSLDL